jgi:hypothetical protein
MMVENFAASENEFTTKEYKKTANGAGKEYSILETEYYNAQKEWIRTKLENSDSKDTEFDYIDYYYNREDMFFYVRESSGAEHILWHFPRPAKSCILLLDPENETITEEDTSGIAWKMFYAFIM